MAVDVLLISVSSKKNNYCKHSKKLMKLVLTKKDIYLDPKAKEKT